MECFSKRSEKQQYCYDHHVYVCVQSVPVLELHPSETSTVRSQVDQYHSSTQFLQNIFHFSLSFLVPVLSQLAPMVKTSHTYMYTYNIQYLTYSSNK